MSNTIFNEPDFKLANPGDAASAWFWLREPADQQRIDATREWCGWHALGRWSYRIETRERGPLAHPYADGRLTLSFELTTDAAALRCASSASSMLLPCR